MHLLASVMPESCEHLLETGASLQTWMVQDCMAKKQLSDAQLETVIYANMRFKNNVPGGQPLCSLLSFREVLRNLQLAP